MSSEQAAIDAVWEMAWATGAVSPGPTQARKIEALIREAVSDAYGDGYVNGFQCGYDSGCSND